MNGAELRAFVQERLKEIEQLFEQTFKEYGQDARPFANFELTGADLEMEPEVVCFILMRKHVQGIAAYLRGVRRQRDTIHGRINDLIVYALLLDAIITSRKDAHEN